MTESSVELFARYQQGDNVAADEIFARYVNRLIELVRFQLSRRLRRRMDAEDAVFSAYRSFFLRARSGAFTVERSGESWKLLLTITLNKLRRQAMHHSADKRSMWRDEATAVDFESMNLNAGPTPLQALIAVDELETFLATLPPLQQQVLKLRLEDCRWDEIAAKIGRSERTVRRVLTEVHEAWVRHAVGGAD